MLAPDFADARYGTWSPEGDKLLFLGAFDRGPNPSSLDWYVAGVDGGEPVGTGAVEVLRRAGVRGVPIPGAWTGDAGDVVFATHDEGRPSNIWQVAISPRRGRVAGEPVRRTLGTATNGPLPSAPSVGSCSPA
jgi:hypothetical protein